MAVSLHRRSGRRRRAMGEINVTPLVDVMLVLLVVFMITAPLLSTGVPVDLPKTDEAPSLDQAGEALTISVATGGAIFLGDAEVALEALAPRVRAMRVANPALAVVIAGDQAGAYGRMVQVMAAVQAAGVESFSLRTDPGPAK